MTGPSRRRSGHLLGAVTSLIALGALCAACGSGGDLDAARDGATPSGSGGSGGSGGSSSSGSVLSEDQLAASTITADNLSSSWSETTWTDSDATGLTGTCLSGLGDVPKPAGRKGTEFDFGSNSIPSINNTVSTYSDAQTAEDLFSHYRDVVQGCDHVDVDLTSDIAWSFSPSITEATPPEGVDQLLEVDFTGTAKASSDGSTETLDAHYSLIRIGNDYSKVAFVGTGTETDLTASLEQIAIAKLRAAIDGTDAPSTTAPDPQSS